MSSNLCALIKKKQTESIGIEDVMRQFSQYDTNGISHVVQIDTEEVNCIYFVDYKMKLHLKDGYYILDSLRRYSSLQNRVKGELVVRDMICDIVKSLGENDAIYFEDKYDYVYENFDIYTLENLLIEEFGPPSEYDKICGSDKIAEGLIHDCC